MEISFRKLAKPCIRNLSPYQPGKSIEELQRDHAISNIIKLASNENPFGASKIVENALKDIANISHYPDPTGYSLKQILSAHYFVEAKQLILGNGSAEVLSNITQAFIEVGDEVVISQYAYSLFEIIARTAGAICQFVPANKYSHNLEAMAAAVTHKTKIIFIANPNNPTGTSVTNCQMEYFLEKIPENILIVIDEAYYEYAIDQDYPDTIALQKKYPNIILTRTFSKAYGLAGLRIGYGIACQEISEILNGIRLSFNVNSVAILAAILAIQDQAHVKKCVEHNKKEKKIFEVNLSKINLSYIPSSANFLAVDFKQPVLEIFNELLINGIIVRPLSNYGMPNHLRITLGSAEENKRVFSTLSHLVANAYLL